MVSDKLTVRHGIPLAFGSIMGSGVLFLPALTYSLAGTSVVWVWVIATVICFPLLIIFRDMFERVPDAAGVAGYIALAMPSVAAATPFLFLGTVSLGMPSAAIIAGQYLGSIISDSRYVSLVLALSIPLISFSFVSFNVKLGARTQIIITVVLVAISLLLFASTAAPAMAAVKSFRMTFHFSPVFLGIVAAFWAYAGFENISFMASDFARPKTDLLISCIVALVICGVIYLGLSFNYATLIDLREIDLKSGLIQLSTRGVFPHFTKVLVGSFAYLSVLLNFNSWVWGISRMINVTAKKGDLPSLLSHSSGDGLPTVAAAVLTVVFVVVILLGSVFPQKFGSLLMLVSGNFVVLYWLISLSYLKINKSLASKIVGYLILVLLSAALFQIKILLLYPISIIFLVLAIKRVPINWSRNHA